MALFADTAGEDSAALAREPLLLRLRQWSDLEDCPLDAVLAQGQLGGEDTPVAPGQAALLRWVGAAHSLWERDYPLEAELTALLRRLKPLTAALAVTDPLFLVPGRHPVHRTLDTIQAAAIGWQASLGRAGGGLMRELESTVARALAWFDDTTLDLGALARELEAYLARDGERAQKMARRVVEMELGRQRKIEAAEVAARMINALLERYQAPEQVGELLKGAWYDSAQLVALKFGADSEQWAHITRTTETLLDSVQVFETEPEGRRQQLFRMVTLVPRELRRWLLSLQHDTDAVEDAVGSVEFAHLCVLRNNPLETGPVAPLPVPGDGGEGDEEVPGADGIDVGQWYLIRRPGEASLRARVIYRARQERQLLFANRAGMEVLRLGLDTFAALLAAGDAIQLQRGASFSRCLALAAGVAGESDLAELTPYTPGEAAVAITTEPAAEPAATQDAEEDEQARLWREWEEARARQQARNRAPGGEQG